MATLVEVVGLFCRLVCELATWWLLLSVVLGLALAVSS
jgi:hypothetical protein